METSAFPFGRALEWLLEPGDPGVRYLALRDLARPADMSRAPDLAVCIKCDAVLNTCPSRGLDCDPVAGCCVAKPADLAVPLR